MAAVAIDLDTKDCDRLRALAEARRVNPQLLMREAVHQYLEMEYLRESMRQEAMDSWQDYQKTGLHLSLAETSAWLDTWGTEAEMEAPHCHK